MSRKILLNDFLKNHILTNLITDDDQTFGLYFDYTLDKKDNVYNKNIEYLDLEGFNIKQLDIPFEVDDFYINEKEVFLKVSHEDSSVFYSYNISDQVYRELFVIPFAVDKFAYSESGFYFTAEVQGVEPSASVKCTNRAPFYKEGRGISGDGVMGLFQSNLDGKDINLITSLDMDVDQLDFDFINKRIVFTAFKVLGLKPIESDLYLYDLLSETISILLEAHYRISYVKSISSNIVLIMGINLDEFSRNDNHQIYQIDIRTGKHKTLGDKLDKSNELPGVVSDSVFSSSLPIQKFKGDFYFKQIERDREMLYRINLKGDYEAIDTGLKTISSFCITDKGIFLIGLFKLKLSELYFFSHGKLNQISQHNQWMEDLFLSKAERTTIKADNIEIDGFVFPPIDIRDDQLYPAVLMIHGGPKMIYSDVFAHDIQLLCANGYFVFCANPMGSDGRGDDFSNIRGNFGDLPYKQLMTFTDSVLEKYPGIDKDRLGVSGGSYGGYMTNYIITRTSRFQAAVSERGISNLMTAFTSSDIGNQFIFEYLGNEITPWSDPIKVIESSPIYQADKAKTPTLFIHGKNDYRCHYTESLNMFSALKYHGIETRLCLFEGENHGLVLRGKPRSKMRRYEEFLSWFNKFLKKGSV